MNGRQRSLATLLVTSATLAALTGAVDAQGREADGGSAWGANYFPNVELVSHEGEHLRFFDDMIEGKVVAINFIYTSCPDACPLETARMVQVQRLLGDRVGKDVFFYSISIDPKTDTPEVLAKYVERYDVGPGWKFLTGDEEDITLLRKKLGLYIQEIQNGTNDHNLSLMIGNQRTGRWMKRSPFENPHVLATQIGGELHNWSTPVDLGGDYSEAPDLRSITKGESMFRTRCASCHIVGEDDGLRRNGPDLFGVTERRDHDWLLRWIAAPDEMLAAEDPIAMGLYFAYDNVAMPNMRLTEGEIEKLLDYIKSETERVREVRLEEELQAASVPPEEPGIDEDDFLFDGPAPCCLKDENVVLSSIDELPEAPEPDEPGAATAPGPSSATTGEAASGGGLSTSVAFFGGLGWLLGIATGLLARRTVVAG